MRSKNNELHFPAICILPPSEAKRIAFLMGIEDLQWMTSLIATGSIYLVDLDFLILVRMVKTRSPSQICSMSCSFHR